MHQLRYSEKKNIWIRQSGDEKEMKFQNHYLGDWRSSNNRKQGEYQLRARPERKANNHIAFVCGLRFA